MPDRNSIICKLQKSLEPLPYIHAFWLEGADSIGKVDEYSDIDFWADVDDEFEAPAIEAVETALSEMAEIDYKYVMRHSHPKIRQRIYHIAGSSEYLMIDFCWQLHSRPKNEYAYVENDTIEAAKVIFDKDGVIRRKPLDASKFAGHNNARLEDAEYRMSQHVRAEKYVRRGQYLEAYACYNKYALDPLICLLRLIYTPAYADYHLVHISQHMPPAEIEKLEYFARISSLDDIGKKLPQAGKWFGELIKRLKHGPMGE